ncbi:MAG: hypothetical protein V4548_02540 [Bacteroidota bacterium]
MNKFIILSVSFLILSCTSKSQNNNPKIEIIKETPKIEIVDSEKVIEEKKASIIYDTLVFEENLKNEMLIEKYKQSLPELNFYKKFIKAQNINKLKIIDIGYDSKSQITYLGELKDLDGVNSYHIITNFTTFGESKGKSDVAFIDETKTKIITYNLPMPSDLPKYIDKKTLCFINENTKIIVSIKGGIGSLLCIPEIGCN